MKEGKDLGWKDGTYNLADIKFKMFVGHSVRVVQGITKSFRVKILKSPTT